MATVAPCRSRHFHLLILEPRQEGLRNRNCVFHHPPQCGDEHLTLHNRTLAKCNIECDGIVCSEAGVGRIACRLHDSKDLCTILQWILAVSRSKVNRWSTY